MITCIKEILELPNFGHMATPHLPYNLNHMRIFVCDIMNKKYDIITFILKYLFFRKAWGLIIFSDVIRATTVFIKAIIKDSRNVKRIRNYESKCNLYL